MAIEFAHRSTNLGDGITGNDFNNPGHVLAVRGHFGVVGNGCVPSPASGGGRKKALRADLPRKRER